MGYIHIFQWKFGNIKYPSSSNPNATVATSGCGPCAALMILENMTDQRYGMQEWINWVISTGARVNGGTDMAVLTKAMAKKFGFLVSTTSDENILRDHLKKGGMAIGNCGGSYNEWRGLFSTSGHFFTIAEYTNDNYFIVLDPNWTEKKFTNQGNSLSKWRSQHAIQGDDSVVYVNAVNLNNDTKTRTPSYYLYTLLGEDGKEEEEMEKVYHWTSELPDWAKPAVQWALDNGILKGTASDDLNITEIQVKTLVYIYRDNERKGTL